MDFLEACQKFIAIDSSTGQGNFELAETASAMCRDAGLDVELHDETHKGLPQANVVARVANAPEGGELLLTSPLDTVDPGSFGLWSATDNNPFSPTIRDGVIYGLGSASGKLDFLCKLKALHEFRDVQFKKPVVLAGTYGSEFGAVGAIRLIRRKQVAARFAMVGGPSGMKAFHAAKGMATVEIVVPFSEAERRFHKKHDEMESSSSQSKIFRSQTADGDGGNAVVKMLRYMAQLPSGIALLEMDGGTSRNTVPSFASLEFDVVEASDESIATKIGRILRAVDRVSSEFKNHEDPGFDPPYPTLNIGMVRTREEYVVFLATCNVPPSVDQEVYERWMAELRDVCERQNSSFRITEYIQPFRTALDSEMVKATVQSLGENDLDYTPSSCPNSTEANVLSRFGVDCVVFGAGRKRDVLQIPNEGVEIQDLEKSVDVYKRVIEKVCL